MLAAPVILLAGCSPQQSALHPAGVDAHELANLFWFMSAAGFVVWLIVMGAAIYAVLGRRKPTSERFGDNFILIGGVAFPTIGLAILLVFGLSLLPSWGRDDVPELRVHVQAEQYWWRLSYELRDGSRLETANELHLPVDAVIEFALTSSDVIHSFWIPALGGKMDAIPGRTNLLRLEPTKPGIYRGVCAEFCGPSHALMAFPVEVHDADGFAAWLEAEQRPASDVGSGTFLAAGCGACHTVRGVTEISSIGPDLTHLAARGTIGAGTLPNNADQLLAWISSPDHIKPDARMPPYESLPESDRRAIVDYLVSLK
ncbi:MAG: cytochrome c oxidase subunit II [Hyphomicrobiales bacterium]|nr:MAG: cytochrome c oxidase subunit II [Hyphomicrobiales bacterium]